MKLMAYMDCKSMCEECDVCEGSTHGWRDEDTRPCLWYVKHDLPVSFLPSTTEPLLPSRPLLTPASPPARLPPSQGCPEHGENKAGDGFEGTANQNCCHCFGSGYGVKSHGVVPARFEKVGEGVGRCLDGTGTKYDSAFAVLEMEESSGESPADACMSVCATTAHGGGLVGIELNLGELILGGVIKCYCLFAEGFLKKVEGWFGGPPPCESEYFDFRGLRFQHCGHYGGIGEVVNVDSSATDFRCYKITDDMVSVWSPCPEITLIEY